MAAYAQTAQEGGHASTDCDYDQARFLTVTDSTDPRFVAPLFEFAVSLLDYLRIAPLVDYKPDAYLAVQGGAIRWWRIDDAAMPTLPTATRTSS